jgi:hypothetical protein
LFVPPTLGLELTVFEFPPGPYWFCVLSAPAVAAPLELVWPEPAPPVAAPVVALMLPLLVWAPPVAAPPVDAPDVAAPPAPPAPPVAVAAPDVCVDVLELLVVGGVVVCASAAPETNNDATATVTSFLCMVKLHSEEDRGKKQHAARDKKVDRT